MFPRLSTQPGGLGVGPTHSKGFPWQNGEDGSVSQCSAPGSHSCKQLTKCLPHVSSVRTGDDKTSQGSLCLGAHVQPVRNPHEITHDSTLPISWAPFHCPLEGEEKLWEGREGCTLVTTLRDMNEWVGRAGENVPAGKATPRSRDWQL